MRGEVRNVGRPKSGQKNKEITGVRLCKVLGGRTQKGKISAKVHVKNS